MSGGGAIRGGGITFECKQIEGEAKFQCKASGVGNFKTFEGHSDAKISPLLARRILLSRLNYCHCHAAAKFLEVRVYLMSFPRTLH